MRGQHPTGTPRSILSWARKLQQPPEGVPADIVLTRPGLDSSTLMRWGLDAVAAGEEWAKGVLETADEDAETRGQLTEYALSYVVGGDVQCTRAIKRGANTSGPEALQVQSAEDVLKMMATQNQMLHRLFIESQVGMMAKYEAIANRQAERIAQLEEERTATMDLYFEGMKAVREVELMENDEESDRRADERIGKFAQLAAMVLGKDADPATRAQLMMAANALTAPPPGKDGTGG